LLSRSEEKLDGYLFDGASIGAKVKALCSILGVVRFPAE
jgi:hypothetical protein